MTEEEYKEQIKKMSKNYEEQIHEQNVMIMTLRTELSIAWLRVGRLSCSMIEPEPSRTCCNRLNVNKEL